MHIYTLHIVNLRDIPCFLLLLLEEKLAIMNDELGGFSWIVLFAGFHTKRWVVMFREVARCRRPAPDR